MSADHWYREPPPPEAYSRVTNPERFRALHVVALELADRLAADFDVVRTDAFMPLPGMTPFAQARPPVTLTPMVPNAAPIAIAFTTFPSLIVRYGRWLADPFPTCGCDACAETAADEAERLERLVTEVVAGRFREELRIPWFGEARLRWALGERESPGGHHGEAFRVLPRPLARALRGGGASRIQWQPWPRRGRTAPAGAPAI